VRADDRGASPAWTPASGQAGEVRVGVLSGDPRWSAGIRDAIVTGLRSGTIGARRFRPRPSSGGPGGRRPARPGRVALVGGGPGDPDLITVRGRQVLSEATVVIADRLAPRPLLDELPPDVEIIDAAKIPYGRGMAQEQINEALVSYARAGEFVVRLKGGDPFVFGRGAEEMLACVRAGVPITVVPGVTSAVAVPAAAGIPVTHRGLAQEFHVVSAHVAPDDERSAVDWAALGASRGTIVLLMAVERIGQIADTLIRHGRTTTTPVSVIQDGTLPTQHTLSATLGTVAEQAAMAGVRPPAVVVVGEVVDIAGQIDRLLPGATGGVQAAGTAYAVEDAR
jgi:uroporphyrin-III C-methyltransferase/precorrin-2 dehydrogenase/sirohydrochlorin ferrochelatase